MFVFYHVSKTVSRILGLQPNDCIFISHLVFLASINAMSCVCQLSNKEYMMIELQTL